MKEVLIFLAEGFEEIEAVTPIDLLRRGGVHVTIVAVADSLRVRGAHGIEITADCLISEVSERQADAIVLPGGLPGVTNLSASQALKAMIQKAYDNGKLVAAICAAPSILGELGMLQGKEATCYPSFEPTLIGYVETSTPVVVSDNVITARSAGVSVDFALAILRQLEGDSTAQAVAKAIITKD